MGTLLDFASAPRPLARVKSRLNTAGSDKDRAKGEVVLFPGVRYEHQSLDLAARIATIGQMAGTRAGEHQDPF
ncbi:hypothetical protein [Roseibium suaedae]|uniref:Uncharacterized protein n=1 Tax=Roseibium suaedae TaxID=735517 RepID=A0A1M7C7K0_9HYPH|nr:hypothetical protein [Roseibium suaedae]SHL63282.1 hypothetical protein SAMN05444272_1091 [Roseibium suaedae]